MLHTLPFPEFTQLAEPCCASDHILVTEAAAAAAAPEVARVLVTTSTEVSWIGGESSRIPVGSITALRFVPVGLLEVMAVLLPVGAVAAPAVAAGAALALTESARDVSFSSEMEIRRCVEGPHS